VTCRGGERVARYIIYEFYFRRPLIGANTHSATAVNRHNNVTILSHRRRSRPIYFLFCRSGDKYIYYVGTEPTMHTAEPKLDAHRLFPSRSIAVVVYVVCFLLICVCTYVC